MKVISILFLLFCAVALLIYLNPKGPPQENQLSQDMIARSKQYIQKLGKQPLEELSTEQKLLLLHAYYNVQDDAAAVRIGNFMSAEIQNLPPERQRPFMQMIEKAKHRLEMKR